MPALRLSMALPILLAALGLLAAGRSASRVSSSAPDRIAGEDRKAVERPGEETPGQIPASNTSGSASWEEHAGCLPLRLEDSARPGLAPEFREGSSIARVSGIASGRGAACRSPPLEEASARAHLPPPSESPFAPRPPPR